MLARSVLRLGQNLSIVAIDFFSCPLAFAWRLLASSLASRPSSVGCASRPWAVGRLSQPAPSQLRLSRREAEPERPPARSFPFFFPPPPLRHFGLRGGGGNRGRRRRFFFFFLPRGGAEKRRR